MRRRLPWIFNVGAAHYISYKTLSRMQARDEPTIVHFVSGHPPLSGLRILPAALLSSPASPLPASRYTSLSPSFYLISLSSPTPPLELPSSQVGGESKPWGFLVLKYQNQQDRIPDGVRRLLDAWDDMYWLAKTHRVCAGHVSQMEKARGRLLLDAA